MSLLHHPFYPGGYALYPGAAPAAGSSRAAAYLPGMMPPHMPLAMPADYGAALGMGMGMPGVGFPMLSAAAHAAQHPDSVLVSTVSKAAAAAAVHGQRSPLSHHHAPHHPNNNNNNNNNKTNGQLTKFTIDEILGKKEGGEKSPSPGSKVPEVVMMPGQEHHHPCTVSADNASSMAAMDASRDCNSSSPGAQEENPDDLDPNARFSWLQCTRYRPPKLPRVKRKDGVKKRKLGRNPRVPFTQHQVNTLEQKFQRTHYLSSVDVAELSAALNLTETRVKIWFQNRRARERRDRENSLESGGAAGGGPGGPVGSVPAPAVPRSAPGGTLSPGGSLHMGRGQFAGWPLPTPPTPSALAHFSHALHQHGNSAFTPVSFSAY